jgi:hypothetical protein
MYSEIDRLRRIIARTHRKAKAWYLRYVMAQLGVLGLAIASVFLELDPRTSAVIAFVGVLAAECIRWRSDFWKDEGDAAKRRWELADGLGISGEDGAIADWLAAKPAGFLEDVSDYELKGSEFESPASPGPRRVVENTEESAWWSKHESRIVAWYLGAGLLVLLAGIFLVLASSVSRLNMHAGTVNSKVTQNIGAITCVVLAFVFSINVVRLFADFVMFYFSSKAIVERCRQLLRSGELDRTDALLVQFDYQIRRNRAPLLPTFIWSFHGPHLRNEWRRFRPRK